MTSKVDFSRDDGLSNARGVVLFMMRSVVVESLYFVTGKAAPSIAYIAYAVFAIDFSVSMKL